MVIVMNVFICICESTQMLMVTCIASILHSMSFEKHILYIEKRKECTFEKKEQLE